MNLVNSSGFIKKLLIKRGFSDALDVDFSNINMKEINVYKSKNDFCNKYWGTKSMRGFYLHHYLAFFDGNYKKNDIFTNLVNSLNHQYGAVTQIFPYLLMKSGINLNVQIFSASSLLVGSILNFLVIFSKSFFL